MKFIHNNIKSDLDKIKYLDSKKWYNIDVNNPLRESWIKDVLQDYHDLTTK